MEKHTKKILGCLGLAAVAAMTGVAIGLPGPEASATSSTSVTYSVTVKEAGAATIISPTDGAVFTQVPVDFTVSYDNASSLQALLEYVDSNGDTQTVELGRYSLSESSGEYQFAITDFSPYGGYGNYVLHVRADGAAAAEDSVSFQYRAVYVEQVGTDENGNPIIDVEQSPDVDHLGGEVYDPDGNLVGEVPVVPNADGEVVIDLSQIEPALPEGDYPVVITAYDADGNVIDQYTVTVHYSPVVPEVPDTGALSFGDLQLSQTDFLLTALVAFALVTGAAFFILRKKCQ